MNAALAYHSTYCYGSIGLSFHVLLWQLWPTILHASITALAYRSTCYYDSIGLPFYRLLWQHWLIVLHAIITALADRSTYCYDSIGLPFYILLWQHWLTVLHTFMTALTYRSTYYDSIGLRSTYYCDSIGLQFYSTCYLFYRKGCSWKRGWVKLKESPGVLTVSPGRYSGSPHLHQVYGGGEGRIAFLTRKSRMWKKEQ